MTVSPQWPQDGNRQPSVGVNGVESDDSLDSPALPPTLFELPNLNQEARGQAQTDQPPASQPTVDHAPANQTFTSQTFQGSLDSDDEPRSPTPPAVSSNIAAPARGGTAVPIAANAPEHVRAPERHSPISHDRPAGRSWMERIGSHSVVVVLLLVVIAAGLVIGRDSRNQGIDSSLADSSNLLDFDEGTKLELPLPKHVYNQPADIATTANAEASVRSQEPAGSALEPTEPPTNAIVASGVSTGPSREAAVDGTRVAADSFADSAAKLNDPRTDLAVTVDAGANSVEVNELNDGSTNVDFAAVSSRIPAETNLSTLPTLDDLDDQPVGAGGLTMPDAKTPAPQLTKTPAPIIDWRLYLPPATADTNVPFTSN